MADQPCFTIIQREKFGAGHEEHSPSLYLATGIDVESAGHERFPGGFPVSIEFVQPGFGCPGIVMSVPLPSDDCPIIMPATGTATATDVVQMSGK